MLNEAQGKQMNYQEKIRLLGDKILNCPNYLNYGECQKELTNVSNSKYKHGPEICYVGKKYGENSLPRILFTRLNPTWNLDIGWFGTKESLEEYKGKYPNSEASDIFEKYLKGWKNENENKLYRGLWDAGTVSGHSNQSKLSGREKRANLRYGIQFITEKMIEAEIFPGVKESSLEWCAINNVIKCSGLLKNYNPGERMKQNCNFYSEEIRILNPDVVIAMGNDADDYIKRKFRIDIDGSGIQILNLGNVKPSYWKFPHPLGQGKTTWKGGDVRHLCGGHEFDKNFAKFYPNAFTGWKEGELLFSYILRLVWEVKRR